MRNRRHTEDNFRCHGAEMTIGHMTTSGSPRTGESNGLDLKILGPPSICKHQGVGRSSNSCEEGLQGLGYDSNDI